MAPSGPRAGSAPLATRATRSGAAGTRSPAAGGIQKRRGGGPRVDRDGDLVLDASASVNGGAGIGGKARGGGVAPRGPRISARGAPTRGDVASSNRAGAPIRGRAGPTAIIKVIGLKDSKAANNPDHGEKSLVEFLERKAHKDKNTAIKKSTLSGDVLYILIAKEDTDAFLKLNDYTYAGAQLTIAESHEPWPGASAKPELSTGAQQAKEGLRNVLSARYDINRKLLDLSSLSTDPQLSQMGIIQAGSGGSLLEKAFKALLIVCDQQFTSAQAKRDSIPSITLASNNISNVTQVFDLAETFPDLKNLDLSNNQLDNLRKLTPWRHRFRSLETLILTGNPLEAAEPNYQADIISWFPKLQILNNVQVRTPEQIEAAAAAVHLNPIPQAGYDFRDAGGVGERFVKQFFIGYDSNRQQLAASFYDEQSTFSLAVSVSAPHEAGSRVPPWKPYLGYSRNLTKITGQGAREQRLFRGPEAISKIWTGLPQTRHPSLETDSHKYIIDCHVLSGLADPSGQSPHGVDGLVITVHGEFEEAEPLTDKIGMRSFTRTFVLGPGGPGGSDVRVSSDMLALRAHTPVPSMQPTTNGAPSQPTQPQPQPQQALAAPQSLPEPSVEVKKQMVYELSKRSNMILQISEQCLMEANWNLDVAWNVFEQKKALLPADAFAVPPQAGMLKGTF